jgi:hypothetical protein
MITIRCKPHSLLIGEPALLIHRPHFHLLPLGGTKERGKRDIGGIAPGPNPDKAISGRHPGGTARKKSRLEAAGSF